MTSIEPPEPEFAPGELLELFEQKRALLNGHFLLSSGLHSEKYLQCALVLQHPDAAGRIGKALARQEGDKQALLRLLRPLHAACESNAFVRSLAASGDVYHPLSWTAEEAHTFLRAVPDCETAGVAVRALMSAISFN